VVGVFFLFFFRRKRGDMLKLLARRYHNVHSKPSTTSTSAEVQMFRLLPLLNQSLLPWSAILAGIEKKLAALECSKHILRDLNHPSAMFAKAPPARLE